jgi:hypothetical protein
MMKGVIMKSLVTVFVGVLLFCCFFTTALSQITITNTDIQNSVLNTRRADYSNGDTLTVNLGSASSSSQSWNFSALPWGDVLHRDTTYENIVLPAGQLRAEEFPSATAASVLSQTTTSGPFTITLSFAQYIELTTSAVKVVGMVLRQQISPPPPPPFTEDSTIVVHMNAKYLPLPLAMGLSETWTDTVKDFDGSYEVQTKTITVNGFGTLTFPDGRTLQVLRMIDDRIDFEYDNNNQFQRRERRRNITFWSQDFTQLEFEVDTNFTEGTTLADGWNFNVKVGTVGVEQTSNGIPESFMLAQNYPNPFNPITSISFSLPEGQYTSLKVYNLLGEEVATLVEKELSAGTYKVDFDASMLPSGLYLYRLSAGQFTQSKKLMLVK